MPKGKTECPKCGKLMGSACDTHSCGWVSGKIRQRRNELILEDFRRIQEDGKKELARINKEVVKDGVNYKTNKEVNMANFYKKRENISKEHDIYCIAVEFGLYDLKRKKGVCE